MVLLSVIQDIIYISLLNVKLKVILWQADVIYKYSFIAEVFEQKILKYREQEC